MSPELREEIKQTRPFGSLAEEAMVNLGRTSAVLAEAGDRLFQAHGITAAQYNVLRILRGAGEAGLGRNEIRERMLDRMPDVTRLLERLEAAGLVRRERGAQDRRCVPTFLTPEGRALVETMDEPVRALHQRHFGHLTPGQLHTLIEALTLVRTPPSG